MVDPAEKRIRMTEAKTRQTASASPAKSAERRGVGTLVLGPHPALAWYFPAHDANTYEYLCLRNSCYRQNYSAGTLQITYPVQQGRNQECR